MTLDKPSDKRTTAVLRRIKAVDKERCKNRLRVDIRRTLTAVSLRTYCPSKDEVEYSNTESLTDKTKGNTDHSVWPASADRVVCGRSHLVVLDGTAHKTELPSPRGENHLFNSRIGYVVLALKPNVSRVSRTGALERKHRIHLLNLRIRQLNLDPEQRAITSKGNIKASFHELHFLPEIKTGKSPSFSSTQNPVVPQVHTTDPFSYPQSFRQALSTTSPAQPTSAINDQLVSFRQALRPTLDPATPSRLENRRTPFQLIGSSPPSASTLHQPGFLLREETPEFPSKPAIEQKQSQYIAPSVELAVPRKPRLLCSTDQPGPTVTFHPPINKDRLPKEPYSDNSDYSRSRPSSEEILIAQGSFIANQNSAYYAQLYTVGNPFTQSPQKSQGSTVRISYNPLASSLQPLLIREASRGADCPQLLSPFDHAPIERKREWKHTERRLTGPSFSSEIPKIPDFSASTGANRSSVGEDDNPCNLSFNQAPTRDLYGDYRKHSPPITTGLKSAIAGPDKLRISTPDKQTSRPFAAQFEEQKRTSDEQRRFPDLASIKPRPSSEPFLGGDYSTSAIEINHPSTFAASDKADRKSSDSAHKGYCSKSALSLNGKLESSEPTNSGPIHEHFGQLPNQNLGEIFEGVPRSIDHPTLLRSTSDPPRGAEEHFSAHTSKKKKKPFAKLKEWKTILLGKQADDNKGEESTEDNSEAISEEDLHCSTRPVESQSGSLESTIALKDPERVNEFARTARKQDHRHKNSSNLLIEKLRSPPIPAKSTARLLLPDREKEARQNQTLAHCGSKFHDTHSIPYPTQVDDIPNLCVLQLDNTSTDSSTFYNSDEEPFFIKLSATESCLSLRTLSTELDTIGDLSQNVLSSLPSTPPTLTISSQERASITFLNHNYAAQAATPNPRLNMDNKLQIRPAEYSSVKIKAVEDAKQMLATVIEAANKSGQDPPKYALLELIGKGSFGRVYKGKDMISAAIVAVKIIDIDESDTVNPRIADSYSDFLKEVNALKILSENKARNINHVIEALPVGQSMWMISEYCGGGSIATLMKPNAPGGLQEKWIIPILREVAEAVKWVHEAGIIHRDIKCANVLITEEGGVQLCDFGVAGIIETKLDKRSTMIGTPHWMAPELFGPTPSYGKEVDIWAFGSMVFEIATGYPPNAANRIPFERLGTHLKHNAPRLEGGNYSNELRDLVAYCLEELPSVRPTIEQVQKHPYIYNTISRYPASTLSHLVRAFKLWEDHGGSRKSLFMLGGAQGPSESSSAIYDDEWNFSTTAAFDQEVSRDSNPQDVYEAYGASVLGFSEETSRPSQQSKPSRRRPPPEALARLPAPLEKIFDPNTLSNYDENSRNHYGRLMPPPTSDLPLRDDSAQTSIRDTMIDLGGHDSETGISNFPDMDTIRADRRGPRDESEDEYGPLHDFSRPALSDPADINPNRRTQDWKFPTMAPPASADPEISRFPASYELQRPAVTPGSGSRPALVHHPTDPLSGFGGILGTTSSAMDRMSVRESLIDLDMSLPDVIPDLTRPSTANSDVGSTASAAGEYTAAGNPFEFEKHASMYLPAAPFEPAGPSTYASEGTSANLQPGSSLQQMVDMSDFSASDVEPSTRNLHNEHLRYDGGSDSDYLSMAPPPPQGRVTDATVTESAKSSANTAYSMNRFPELPPPPSAAALSGLVSRDDMREEILRQLTGMTNQLSAFKEVYESPMIVNRVGQSRRTGRAGDGNGGG